MEHLYQYNVRGERREESMRHLSVKLDDEKSSEGGRHALGGRQEGGFGLTAEAATGPHTRRGRGRIQD